MKKTIIHMLCIAMLFALTSCAEVKNQSGGSASGSSLPDVVTGTLVFKDYGTIKFELYPNRAKQSSLNFIYLAKQGFYNGIVVHRLVSDFVIQAGAYETGYVERNVDSPYTIVGEFTQNGIENTIKHEKGTLSWARPSNPNGASTQFFICTKDNANVSALDGNYAAFGKVIDGLDIIETINSQETNSEVPVKEILIESVTIDSDYEFPEPEFRR